MKIAYISFSVLPSRTANSIHVMKMAQALADNGHDAVLITYGLPREEDKSLYDYYGVKNNFEILRFPIGQSFLSKYIYAFKTIKWAKKNGYDMVYTRFLPVAFVANLLEVKCISESHYPENSTAFNRWMFRKVLKSRSIFRLVVISEALKKIMTGIHGASEKYIVAHDAADLPNLNEALAAQFPLQFHEHRFKVGYVGHLYSGRGIEVIIELAKRCPHMDFHLVGGTESDIQNWTKILRGGNLANIFLHGFVEPRFTAVFRSKMDVLLAPYQDEVSVGGGSNTAAYMSPLKVFEYLSSGKAIISSDMPVLREVYRDGENALLCPSDDVEAWEKALNQLFENSSFREKLGTNAYEDFITEFTWQKRAEQIVKWD